LPEKNLIIKIRFDYDLLLTLTVANFFLGPPCITVTIRAHRPKATISFAFSLSDGCKAAGRVNKKSASRP